MPLRDRPCLVGTCGVSWFYRAFLALTPALWADFGATARDLALASDLGS